jgi:hypothetical protein
VISGPLRSPQTEPAAPREQTGRGGRPRILLVSEPLARKREVQQYVEAIVSCGRFELCVKLRPEEDPDGLRAYGLDPQSLRILQTPTVYEAFAQVDLVLGTYSTVLYEAGLSLIPTVWLRTAIAYGRELAEEGLAQAAEEPASVVAAIERALRLAPEELQRRRDRIWLNAAGDGASRLMDFAEARLWPDRAHRKYGG